MNIAAFAIITTAIIVIPAQLFLSFSFAFINQRLNLRNKEL